MKVIRKKEDEIKEVNYPRKDIKKPVVKLEKGIQYYWINEEERPKYDTNKSRLDYEFQVTTEKHSEYDHFLICNKVWTIIDFNQQVIIQKLNKSVGDHLTECYPEYKRIKHIREKLSINIINPERLDYINQMQDWETSQRTEADKRRSEFINNNIFPSFIWEPKPEKL